MEKSEISALISYNFWADERILAMCEKITTGEFTRQFVPNPGWGSLRGILVHALDTEYGWRLVLQGQTDSAILEEADFANLLELKARWEMERAAWLAYESDLNKDGLNRGYGNDPGTSPKVWQTIVHVVNHGTQHRSEAALILTGYGRSPGELDFDTFLSEHPGHVHN